MRAAAAYDALQGTMLSYSAVPAVFPTAAWRTTDGGAFVTLAVSSTHRLEPMAGHGPMIQPADRSVWPKFLAPGARLP